MINISNPAHLFLLGLYAAIPVICALVADMTDGSPRNGFWKGLFCIYTFMIGLMMATAFIAMIAKLL
jgi:hypothetical protein